MRSATRVGMVLAMLFAAIVLPGSAAQACRCAPLTPDERVASADAVFFGEIVDRTPAPPDQQSAVYPVTRLTYTIDVEQVFKGKVTAQQTLLAGGGSSSCGLTLPASGSVLVYGYRAPGSNPPPLVYATSSCSDTEMTKRLPGFLGEGDPPIGAGSAYKSELTMTPDADGGGAMPVVIGGVIVALFVGLGVVAFVTRRRRPSGVAR